MAKRMEFDVYKMTPEQLREPHSLSIVRYRGPAVADLDEQGRRLYYRACDLSARLWLNDNTIAQYDAKEFDGCAMLVHAERYLADRLAYELAPWPKGKIKIEPDDAYALPAERGSKPTR